MKEIERMRMKPVASLLSSYGDQAYRIASLRLSIGGSFFAAFFLAHEAKRTIRYPCVVLAGSIVQEH